MSLRYAIMLYYNNLTLSNLFNFNTIINHKFACLFNLALRVPKYIGNSKVANAFIYDFHLFLLFSLAWFIPKKHVSIHNAMHITITMPSTLIIGELRIISKQVNIKS